RAVHTEQYLCTTGLGNAQFSEAAVALMSIHQLFERRLGQGSLHQWDVKKEQGHIALDFHNQYLTTPENTSAANIIDIPDDMDPFHILRRHITDEVFTMDGLVKYYERVKPDNVAKPQFKKSHSTAISVGQLVEIQTSFVAVPRGKGKYKMVCKLRSICDINRERVEQALRKGLPTQKVKHVVGYDDDK
ncbi:uncharacterized protein B0H18DRAFT_890696, partial [Fomitopsis serialis]|uniref:uncharacterized protein n=1 Tax=Fomitopsis serialis TaxID=139415 RepID=UPI0020078547